MWINNPYFTSIFQTIISILFIAQGIIDYKNMKATEPEKKKKELANILFYLIIGIGLLITGLQKTSTVNQYSYHFFTLTPSIEL